MTHKTMKTTIYATVQNETNRRFSLSAQNVENREIYLSAKYAERAYIYGYASLTRADASFCRKGLKSRPFPKQSISRQLPFFQTKIKVGFVV